MVGIKCLIFLSSQNDKYWIQQFSGVDDILFPIQLTDFNVWRNGDVCISNSVENGDECVSLEKCKKIVHEVMCLLRIAARSLLAELNNLTRIQVCNLCVQLRTS